MIGIYILIFKANFIYIGKSKDQDGVKSRLERHRRYSHNSDLGSWIKTPGIELRFIVFECTSEDLDDLEKSLIKHFQPTTNELMYSSYKPKNKFYGVC